MVIVLVALALSIGGAVWTLAEWLTRPDDTDKYPVHQ